MKKRCLLLALLCFFLLCVSGCFPFSNTSEEKSQSQDNADEQNQSVKIDEAIAKFESDTKEIPPEVLFMPVEELNDFLDPLWMYVFCDCDYINSDELYDIELTEMERALMVEAFPHTISLEVRLIDSVQAGVDNIWGKKRINVRNWPNSPLNDKDSDNPKIFETKSGYFVTSSDGNDNIITGYYEMKDAFMSKNTCHILAYGLGAIGYWDDQAVFDLAVLFDDSAEHFYTELYDESYRDETFAGYYSLSGASYEDLHLLEFIYAWDNPEEIYLQEIHLAE